MILSAIAERLKRRPKDDFKGRHFEAALILQAVSWYLRYPLSYRDIEELFRERGLAVDHSTLNRWVLAYAPLIEKRLRAFRKPHYGSIRVDETYIKIRGHWRYLYRAIDKHGTPVDFLLTAKRDLDAAKRFFRKMLQDQPLLSPDRIGTDGAGAYPPAIAAARKDGLLARTPVHYVTKHLQRGSRATTSGSRSPCRGSAAFNRFTRPGARSRASRCYGADGGEMSPSSLEATPMERPMPQQLDDLSRSLTPLEQDSTVVAVIEMSQASWLVAGIVPGIERHPLKKLEPSEVELLRLLMRWRAEATQKGCTITRIAVAYEAGRDGFWLARWLRARGIEAYVIHPTSVAVSREHRRAKTDRLDTGLLKRVFIGWLRGEPDHCHMAPIPTLAEEDAKRPNREREGLVRERTRLVNRMKGCLARFGVRTFKPTLRNAPDRLATLQTPEGVPLPPNTLLELRRDMARLRFVMDQIKEVEEARAQELERAPEEKTQVRFACSPASWASALRQR